ncbi:hypothetical protein V6N11_071311 [Hibiscus sabdariffa]|uniref:Uncharacterized protein n=1 Tax=Hibiscus sabdariffa TaxID=183260 RepID=A0ABR2TZP5_9ROSI
MKHRYREVGGRVIVRKFSENLNSDIETVDFGGGGAISERKAGVRVKKGRNKDKEKGSSFLQQSVIQTELFEIRRHLNDKFDRLFVVVGNPSHDLSTSKAPTAQ